MHRLCYSKARAFDAIAKLGHSILTIFELLQQSDWSFSDSGKFIRKCHWPKKSFCYCQTHLAMSEEGVV